MSLVLQSRDREGADAPKALQVVNSEDYPKLN